MLPGFISLRSGQASESQLSSERRPRALPYQCKVHNVPVEARSTLSAFTTCACA